MPTLAELQERAYRQSAEKGFHDNEPAVGEPGWLENDAMKLALMHSEISEALEELRSGRRPDETYYVPTGTSQAERGYRKPEGVPSEIADVVIRALDYCGARAINLEAIIIEKLNYNATRARMHGGRAF